MRLTRQWAALGAALLLAAPSVAIGARPAPAAAADYPAHREAWQRHDTLEAQSLFRGLGWRSIGPVKQGGRVVDIASVSDDPHTFYVAFASGGLWRTTNNGGSFEPLFDHMPTMIMGDIAVDPSDPDTVWVGTGENNSSRSSYGGMGVYRSTDGGESWQHMGLGDTDRIGRIRIDPNDPKRIFVAALGKLYTEGGQRGVYRSTDGGESWEQVLAGGPRTGFVDLALHPDDPDVLYAAAWERFRRPWNFVEAGEGSGIYKSTDGGESWRRLEDALPQGEHVGRIGLAIAPSQPQRVYAVIDNQKLLPEDQWDLGGNAITPKRLKDMTREQFLEQDPEQIEDFIRANDLQTDLTAEKLVDAVQSGEITLDDLRDELDEANADLFRTDIHEIEVWRSDNGGEDWSRSHEEPLREVGYTYGYYFGQIRAAPDDADQIYVLGVPLIRSDDGGKTFQQIAAPDVHVDHHALWIDPVHPDRIIAGNDGGIDVSYDRGQTWRKLDAIPVGQFYAINVDMAEPYHVYGGTQDNGTWKGSHETQWRQGERWTKVGGGDGMYVAIDPRDNQQVYFGFQFGHYSRREPGGGTEKVRPRDALGEPALRYNWMTPVILSEHQPDIVYFGASKLYRSLDQGDTWTAISPDLSRSDKRGNVPFATITTISESPKAFGRIWAGTDDGQVHVTTDGGESWQRVVDGLPRERWVSRVEASHHDRSRAYVSLNGYRDDDATAYVYRTDDLGEHWRSIAEGLPAEPVNVVKEDPVNEDVLYVGTDKGVYVSLDRGESWQALMSGLPTVPVHDLVVHPRERHLIAGTHGRSVWLIDALPIQELSEVRGDSVAVFPLEPVQFKRQWRSRRSRWFHRPETDPERDIPFWAADDGTAVLRVRDDEGHVLRRIEQDVQRGINTFTWDLLLNEELALEAEEANVDPGYADDDPTDGEDIDVGSRAETPWAEAVRLGWPLYITPGEYTIEIEAHSATAETALTVEPPEPREPRAEPEPPMRGEDKDEDED